MANPFQFYPSALLHWFVFHELEFPLCIFPTYQNLKVKYFFHINSFVRANKLGMFVLRFVILQIT